MGDSWTINVLVHRQKGNGAPHFDRFTLQVRPDEYVIDAVERVWAFHDRSLIYAHACHHSVCGACGMLVNGVEKLTCITPIQDVVANGGTIKVEPMRNFPIIGDLVVDLSSLYSAIEVVGGQQVVLVTAVPERQGIAPITNGHPTYENMERLVDCIECGLCMSACPIVGTTAGYLGPAVLANAQVRGLQNAPDLLSLVDHEDGIWRCHGIHECTEVCPSNVEPAWRIMDLRKQVVQQRFKRLFGAR